MEVWHAISPNFGVGTPRKFPDEYVKVALLKGDSIDDAYHLTNNINHPWWQNEGVTVVGEPGQPLDRRSTSAGDVVVIGGTPYRFLWDGFALVEPVESDV